MMGEGREHEMGEGSRKEKMEDPIKGFTKALGEAVKVNRRRKR